MNHDSPDNEILCQCSGTRRGQIRACFLQGLDADAISRKTGALSGCGGCEWDIDAFLAQLADGSSKPAVATGSASSSAE